MTPFEIQILMHHWCIPGAFPSAHSHAYAEAVERFAELGILEVEPDDVNLERVKGNADALRPYIEALRSVPLPEKRWVIPEP